ncbi:MAG: EF-P lysine aminoacylase EpmA [Gammaproteobacteria bacterium]|nr:EF-P lysine aminoacylase EpmA [Gammaproteobacteria bacterium]
MTDWQPSASIETLKLRARLLQQLRAFFHERDVWEVETPILSQAATTDPHIDSFVVNNSDNQLAGYLHTSPEFPMKRLLAAGSGSIYQVSKVFRSGELGRRHNPEFTLIEWYRMGFDYHQLMDEVDALVRELLSESVSLEESVRITYQQAFLQFIGIDPFSADIEKLKACALEHDISGIELGNDKDAWLDLLVSHVLEKSLPTSRLVFIYDYPETQASLARIRQVNSQQSDSEQPFAVGERFELYLNGMELANGFHELANSNEQRRRFEENLSQRLCSDKDNYPLDEHFLSALTQGLPDCSGVALGFDRLVMLAADIDQISEVMSFDYSRA